MNTTTTNWWYATGQQKYGPYPEAHLRDLAQQGQVPADALVWHQGMDDWVSASSIEGLIPANLPPALPATLDVLEPTPVAPAMQEAPQERLLRAFVGSNYGFYRTKWDESEKSGNAFSWNWAAFFLGLFWLAYRKMYFYCGIVIGIAFGITLTAQVLQLPPETLQQWHLAVAPIFSLVLGLFGNKLYKMHALQKIDKIKAGRDTEQAAHIVAQQGGASMLSVLAVLVAMMGASILITTVVAQFLGQKP